VTSDGKVYVVMNLGGADAGNKVFQVYPRTESVEMAAIPFKKPFGSFCLASERAGTAPSNTIDIFGNQDSGNKMCYGQVRLK
jgi:hypothetical protein